MPVVPSFGNFAPTPNVAEAYGHGTRARLQKDQIRQAAAEASGRLSLGYAQIAQQQQEAQMRYQAAQMEMQSKQALAQQEMLRQQQELEMTQAYRQAQIGLEKQNFERLQSETVVKLQEAARQASASEAYRKEPSAASWIKNAPDMGFNPQSGSGVPRAASTSAEVFLDPETQERRGMIVTPEGATSGQYVPDRAEGADASIGIRTTRLLQDRAAKRKELDDVAKEITDREQYRGGDYDKKGEASQLEQQNLLKEFELKKRRLQKEYSKIEAELDQLQEDAAGGRRLQAPTLAPGPAPTSGSTTNRIGRFEMLK